MSDINCEMVSLDICPQQQTIILMILYQRHIFFCMKMLNFEPKDRWEVLLYFFNVKKSAVESHRLLVEALPRLSTFQK